MATTLHIKQREERIPCVCEVCKKVFYVQPCRAGDGAHVRFCSKRCRKELPPIRKKPTKYSFTPKMDWKIKKVYQNNVGKRRGLVKALSRHFSMPRYAIQRRALHIGAYVVCRKEPEWSNKEIRILTKYAHLNPHFIQAKLKRAGFHRSEMGIFIKRKRLRLLRNLSGFSASKCAEVFGEDNHWVIDKIKKGLLKAEMRHTKPKPQSGDYYFIKEKDMREFIIGNPELVDFRKVDKFYIVELLANGAVH